jgi:multidrug efflux pump subunit AcrA (membrane-fusion protein)
VRGQVIELSSSFVPGGMVRQGDMLLRIDPADFRNAVSVRQSQLEQVEANWEIEKGRKKLAKQELDLLGDSIGGINRALVLREPQSASIMSQLNAAKAAVKTTAQ